MATVQDIENEKTYLNECKQRLASFEQSNAPTLEQYKQLKQDVRDTKKFLNELLEEYYEKNKQASDGL